MTAMTLSQSSRGFSNGLKEETDISTKAEKTPDRWRLRQKPGKTSEQVARMMYDLITPALVLVAICTRKDLALICAAGSLMGEWVWAANMDYYSTIIGFAMTNLAVCLAAVAHYSDHRCDLSVSVGQLSLMMLIVNFLQSVSHGNNEMLYVFQHVTGVTGWLLVILLSTQDGRREWVDDMANGISSLLYRHFDNNRGHGSGGSDH